MPHCARKWTDECRMAKAQGKCKEAGNESCFKSYPPRMTEEEFAAEQKEVLEGIPDEFKGVLSPMAWERGHSAGYEEVILVLRDMVDDLREPIKKFQARIESEARKA